jgi:hypothetical protein
VVTRKTIAVAAWNFIAIEASHSAVLTIEADFGKWTEAVIQYDVSTRLPILVALP